MENKRLISKIKNNMLKCGHSYLKGYCPDCKTDYLKTLYCGQEFCNHLDCQKKTTNRRMARKFNKFIEIFSDKKALGYWVFTLPKECRDLINQDKLRQIQKGLKNIIKSFYPNIKIIGRWHWFNDLSCLEKKRDFSCPYQYQDKYSKKLYCNCYDKKECKSQDFNNFQWKPHLNLLSNTKYISKEVINLIKNSFRLLVNKIFFISIKEIVVNYQYTKKSKKAMHWFKYSFRNTFRTLDGYEDKAIIIYKFRNSIEWGVFERLKGHQLEQKIKEIGIKNNKDFPLDTLLLMNGICINCNNKIVWYKEFYTGIISNYWQEINETGYYYWTGYIDDRPEFEKDNKKLTYEEINLYFRSWQNYQSRKKNKYFTTNFY